MQARDAAGQWWQNNDPALATKYGTALADANVRRDFRRVVQAARLELRDWTPRELRHSFVSLLSVGGMPIEQISRLVGPQWNLGDGADLQETDQPVVEHKATVIDRNFPTTGT